LYGPKVVDYTEKQSFFRCVHHTTQLQELLAEVFKNVRQAAMNAVQRTCATITYVTIPYVSLINSY